MDVAHSNMSLRSFCKQPLPELFHLWTKCACENTLTGHPARIAEGQANDFSIVIKQQTLNVVAIELNMLPGGKPVSSVKFLLLRERTIPLTFAFLGLQVAR
jgi:hypothetical protein